MFVNILGNEDFFMTMTKKVAVINDLSGLGPVSYTHLTLPTTPYV